MIIEQQEKAYREFAQSAFSNEVLGPKTTYLIQLATAMSIGCYP